MSDIPGFSWTMVDDYQQVPEVIEKFGRNQQLGFDFETTGLHYMKDEVHSLGLASPDQAWYLYGEDVLEAVAPWLKDTMENPNVQTIAHNLKFDYHFLKQLDPSIKIANPVDTMVAQHLVDENESLKLKKLAPRRLNLPDLDLPDFKELQLITKANDPEKRFKRYKDVTIWDMNVEMLGEYAAKDAWLTLKIWEGLYWDLAQESQMKNFFEIEMPFIEVLLNMERNGMYLHLDELYKLRKVWRAQLTRNVNKWDELTNGINHRSNPQLTELFYEELGAPVTRTTKKNNPSVDALAIQRLSHREETKEHAELLLKIRKFDKLLSTYVDPWIDGMYDGHIYGNYNHTGTVTGRLSSSNPNLQNIPAHGELGSQLRLAIGAPPDSEMLVIDYSQIELRLVAAYAQVSSLISLFKEGGDPHQLTADRVGVPRHIAKNLNFAWLYGAGPRKFCDMVEEKGFERPREKQAKAWFNGFSDAYPELEWFKDEALKRGRRRGHVRTIWGRRRHLPDLNNPDNNLRSRAERQAVNSIIQGSAGDLIKYAMLQIDPLLPKYGARMHGQVHDELIFTYPPSIRDEFIAMVEEKMEEVEEVFGLPVPIIAESATAMTWGEAKHD